MKFRFFVPALLAGVFSTLLATAPAYAIIGGTTVTTSGTDTQTQYPWMGLLMTTGTTPSSFSCGVTLIGARFAVTAAHCVEGQSTDNMYVSIGGYDTSNPTGQTIKVSSYIQNPDFNATTTSGDTALLILDENATNVTTPIYITQVDIGSGKTATILGWGSTDVAGPTGPFGANSDLLRQAQVSTVDRATCEAALNGNASGYVVDATVICAGIASGAQDTCTGDSGGPIFIIGRDGKPVQIGITSWGVGCGQANTPGAYANLASMLGFFLDNLGGQTAINLIDYALTNDQAQVARIFDRLGAAAAAGTDMRRDYGRLFMNGVAGTSNSLQSMLPTSAHEMTAIVSSFVSIQSNSIMAHVRNLHQGLTGGLLDMNGLRFTSSKPVGSVDRTTGLSVPNTMYGANGGYETTTAADDLRSGGIVDLTRVGNANEAAKPTSNKMYSPSLYVNNGEAVAPLPRLASPATRRVNAATANDVRAVGYDENGNPVRPVIINPRPQTSRYAPPNAATEEANASSGGVLSWFANLFGGGSTSDVTRTTASGKALPRTTAMTGRDRAYLRSSTKYPGQPLGNYYGRQHTLEDDGSVYGDNASSVVPPAPPSYREASAEEVETVVEQPSMVSQQATTHRRPMINSYAKIVDSSGVGFPSSAVNSIQQTEEMPIGYGAQAPAPVNADRRWGLFMSGDVRFGREQLLRHSMATTVNDTGFTVGADYRVADKSFVGLALTYAHASFTTGDYSDVQGDGYALSLYGTTNYLTHGYVDGFVSVGLHRFDSERTIFMGNGQKIYANADPKAMHVAAQVETGYDHVVNDWHMGPFLGFKLAYASFDGYSERDASSFNLRVYDRKDLSAIGSLGAGISRRYAMGNIGGVWSPGLRVAYNHEFGRGYSDVKSHFLADSLQQTFVTEGAHRERDWLSVNPTVTAALANNWMFQAYYAHDFFRYNEDNHSFNLSARYKW